VRKTVTRQRFCAKSTGRINKEGKHLGGERIRPMSTWPSLSFSFLLVVGGFVRSCFTLLIFKISFCGQ